MHFFSYISDINNTWQLFQIHISLATFHVSMNFIKVDTKSKHFTVHLITCESYRYRQQLDTLVQSTIKTYAIVLLYFRYQ